MPKRCLRNALGAEWASKTFGGPLWNVKHQKPCETATTNNTETLPTKRIKKKKEKIADHKPESLEQQNTLQN